MKRYKDLYTKICNIDNIKLAHENASKGKQKYVEVKMVNNNLDYYCGLIKEMLESREYSVADYRVKECRAIGLWNKHIKTDKEFI